MRERQHITSTTQSVCRPSPAGLCSKATRCLRATSPSFKIISSHQSSIAGLRLTRATSLQKSVRWWSACWRTGVRFNPDRVIRKGELGLTKMHSPTPRTFMLTRLRRCKPRSPTIKTQSRSSSNGFATSWRQEVHKKFKITKTYLERLPLMTINFFTVRRLRKGPTRQDLT